MKLLSYIFNYLTYFFTSDTKYNIHSPFVFDFVVNVLNARKQKPHYHPIELLRTKMLKSDVIIELLPLGASKQQLIKKDKIKNVCSRTSKSAKYSELLERICAYYQPEFAIEIGTSLGISAMYQASALHNGVLYTLEGNPDSLKVAQYNCQKLDMQNIVFVEGNFDEKLPQLLHQIERVDYVFFDGNHQMDATLKYFEWCLSKAHTNSIFVFDDIRWSEDMQIAWEKIKKHPAVTLSIDLFVMGIVFFRKENEKQDFVIRF
jgi:predicted O-methyltransferase YrrM